MQHREGEEIWMQGCLQNGQAVLHETEAVQREQMEEVGEGERGMKQGRAQAALQGEQEWHYLPE